MVCIYDEPASANVRIRKGSLVVVDRAAGKSIRLEERQPMALRTLNGDRLDLSRKLLAVPYARRVAGVRRVGQPVLTIQQLRQRPEQPVVGRAERDVAIRAAD